ncbi:hypothetical protein PHISCL_06354 [Aspergillus sclerotialis]|uniref:DNA replication factor Cdt1 C-terminal domain-containing protein n=1 Tax=Aspergillus sclerotialis TaxID=2070753 RepID=A0A3A2ZWA2_9EURO|nr:hypothetical protein PHISCL_06354 [Aspergillus sclerotialis]
MPRASTRQPCLPRGQAGIQNYARTTKPGTASAGKAGSIPVSPSKKRKLSELENVESGKSRVEDNEGHKEGPTLTPSKSLRIAQLSVSSPRSGHYASSPCPKSPSSNRRKGKADTGRRQSASGLTRPTVYYDMINLHSAFLKALTIHTAHNGVSNPADLREFLPSVQRIWKKRKVVVKDLQRLIWIWNQGTQSKSTGYSYRVANYGLGKVCLERVVGEVRVDENQLQDMFERQLDLLWEKANIEDGEGNEKGEEFIETLGVSPIHESLTCFTTFRKGQQRLQDLKGGVIRLKTEKLRTEPEDDGAPKQTETASARRQGLWDRIKNKQLRQSKLPPPPSKEMLLHRAAAERVEEVAGTLAMLRPDYVESGPKGIIAAQRKPFRLDTIVQRVQDSMQTPISPREVEICIELLAQPNIAGQWVNIVTVNQLKSVVLKSCTDISFKEIGTSVSQMSVGREDLAKDN